MIDLITDNLPAIEILCRKYGVRKLEVFGSATTDRFDPETSDIDLIIEFGDYGPGVSKRFFRFTGEIERLFGHDVDFVFGDNPIRNPYLRSAIDEQKVPIFEADDEKAAA